MSTEATVGIGLLLVTAIAWGAVRKRKPLKSRRAKKKTSKTKKSSTKRSRAA